MNRIVCANVALAFTQFGANAATPKIEVSKPNIIKADDY